MMNSIKSKNSVAIHVRRVEYNSKLNLNYYMKGIDFLKSKLESPFFYVFSDDISWCKENFKDSKYVFIEEEDVVEQEEDVEVMSPHSCFSRDFESRRAEW